MWCCSSRHCVRTSRRPRNTTRRRWTPWYVRVCPVRARVSGRLDGPNATTTGREHLREFHLNLVRRPFANRETIVVIFYRTRPSPSSSSRVFEFAASHVSLQSVALSCIVWSSRVARRASPARVSRPCHARSPGPAIARGRGVSRVVHGLFGNFPVSKSPQGPRGREGRALRRSEGRRGNLVSSPYRV